MPSGFGVPNEWLGFGVPRFGFGVPWFWSAGVAERLICDMFGLTSPFVSGAGDIGTLVSVKIEEKGSIKYLV